MVFLLGLILIIESKVVIRVEFRLKLQGKIIQVNPNKLEFITTIVYLILT